MAEMEEIKRWANPKDKSLVGDPSLLASDWSSVRDWALEAMRSQVGANQSVDCKEFLFAGFSQLIGTIVSSTKKWSARRFGNNTAG